MGVPLIVEPGEPEGSRGDVDAQRAQAKAFPRGERMVGFVLEQQWNAASPRAEIQDANRLLEPTRRPV